MSPCLTAFMKPLPVRLAPVVAPVVAFAFTLAACAGPGPLPEDAARAERKAYAACAVQAAFSAPLPVPGAAVALAREAIGTCTYLRQAVVSRLMTHFANFPDADALALSYVGHVDAALASHLSLRLREAALRNLAGGSGRRI